MLNHKLHGIMKKKAEKGDVLSEHHAKAKSDILQNLVDDMMGMDSDKVKGLKKVTVASNSPHGLAKGLEKAKEIVGDKDLSGMEDEHADSEHPEHEMHDGEEHGAEDEAEESPEHEAEESPEEESEEHEEMSEEDKDKEIEDLEAEIAKLKEKLAKHNLA